MNDITPTLESLIFLDFSQQFKPFRSLPLNMRTHLKFFLVLEITERFCCCRTFSLSLLLCFLVVMKLYQLQQHVTLVNVGHF